jgi:small conductance mechanosensitive channel
MLLLFLHSANLDTLLLVSGAFIICLFLHWLIGRSQRQALANLEATRATDEDADEGTEILAVPAASMRRLLIEWSAKGLRTLVWLLFFVFLLALLPHARDRFEDVAGKLKERVISFDEWLVDKGLSSVIVIVVTIFLMRFVGALIRTSFELYERRVAERSDEKMRRRLQTLSAIFWGFAETVIFFIGLLVALQQAGLNITPILASAGIIGIAVGFGAQSLIRDIFAGFMVLLEDQYSVGDTIKVGEVTGTVEALTLRSTRVRGSDGALTIFPNGSIATVANLSKDWMRMVLDFDVDYTTDVDRAMELMQTIAATMQEERAEEILEEPKMQGIDKVAEGNLTLRLTMKTLPGKQSELARELRRRIKIAFDQEGIKGPVRPNP